MRRHFVVALCVVLTSSCRTAAPLSEPVVDLNALLAVLGLTPDDVTLRGDYVADPDRLSLNTRLLSRPLDAEEEVQRVAAQLRMSIGGALRLSHETLVFDGLPLETGEPLSLLEALDLAYRSVSGGSPGSDLFSIVHPDSGLTQPMLDRLLAEGRSIDLSAVVEVACVVVDALAPMPSVDRVGAAGMDVIVGTTGRDTFRTPARLIVDPGGDDVYVNAGVSSWASRFRWWSIWGETTSTGAKRQLRAGVSRSWSTMPGTIGMKRLGTGRAWVSVVWVSCGIGWGTMFTARDLVLRGLVYSGLVF